MSDSPDDDGRGKVFDFKRLIPKVREIRRRREREAGKVGPFFSRDADDARHMAEIADKLEVRKRPVAARPTQQAPDGLHRAMHTVTHLSTESSLVRRLTLKLPLWMTANRVTLFRTMLLLPILLLLAHGQFGLAVPLYAFAMFLDFVDGAIAKNREMSRSKEQKTLGAFYDSTADKIVHVGILVYITSRDWIIGAPGLAAVIFTCAFALSNVFTRLVKLGLPAIMAIFRTETRILELSEPAKHAATAPTKTVHEILVLPSDHEPQLAATDAGKIKLGIEVVAISLLLTGIGRHHEPTIEFGIGFLALALVFAFWSFLDQCATIRLR